MNLSPNNINKPSPFTFQKIKKAIGMTTTFVIALLLMFGYSEQSQLLLVIKLSQSFVMEIIDFLAGGNETEKIQDVKEIIKDDTKPTL